MKLRLLGQVTVHMPPNKPMKLTVAFGARSLSAWR
jgi:hypothetical protein